MKQTRALSLIEVVASLALLATSATALMVAHARSLEQISATRDQAAASALAGNLIATWKLDSDSDLDDCRGLFDSKPSWRWKRTCRPCDLAMRSGLFEITLTVLRADVSGAEQVLATYTWLERDDEIWITMR